MTPSWFQVPPRPKGASQTVCTWPPDNSNFFTFPSAKNPRYRPSGDQNGSAVYGPANEVNGTELEPSRSHTQISWLPERSEANAIRFPSGEYCGV